MWISSCSVALCAGPSYKAWEICKHSFLNLLLVWCGFGWTLFFLISICLNPLSFVLFQVSRSGPRSKKNAKNFILFCVATERRHVITWLSPPLINLQWPRFVRNLAQNCIVIRGCSHEIREDWQNRGGNLITKILKHFFLGDKDPLCTLIRDKLAHVYSKNLWS